MTEMTPQLLRSVCEKNKGYRTAYLNDTIYLHYKGFRCIENLEEYTGLKVIWLEGNSLRRIEGLDAQQQLRTLYLHENAIERIEGLHHPDLVTLNLSQNCIETVENLEDCPKLQTLLLSHNQLSTVEGLEGLRACPELSVLDIQHNDIEDPAVLDLLEQLPSLKVLYLQGNPCVKKIPHYRKTVVSRLKQLKYLDDRPVFDEERLRCEAWAAAFEQGGARAAAEAERDEVRRQRAEKEAKDERNFRAFEAMMQSGLRQRESRERRLREEQEAERREGAFLTSLEGPGSGDGTGREETLPTHQAIHSALRAADEAAAPTASSTAAAAAAASPAQDSGSDTGRHSRGETEWKPDVSTEVDSPAAGAGEGGDDADTAAARAHLDGRNPFSHEPVRSADEPEIERVRREEMLARARGRREAPVQEGSEAQRIANAPADEAPVPGTYTRLLTEAMGEREEETAMQGGEKGDVDVDALD